MEPYRSCRLYTYKYRSVHFAALTIKIAKALFEKYISNYSDCAKEAVLVTFYKQGPNYFNRFFNKFRSEKPVNFVGNIEQYK